jgi:hypothetical protein
MQKIFACLLLWACWASPVFPQKQYKYWVEFSDKNNSPYSTRRPWEFLAPRALERRARANIAVVENDLPPNPSYLNALKDNGLQIHHTSRWLNAATVRGDSAQAAAAARLPFVRKVQYLGPHLKYRNPPNRPAKKRAVTSTYPQPAGAEFTDGYAARQNNAFSLFPLHRAGHRGRGIWIAVMDGGFSNADTIPLFDSVGLQGRLFAGWDFVERDAGVFEAAQHGTSVLSVMASNLPGFYVGTAPDATYFLLKTEDTGGEFPVEEANWIAGAEWADSVGVDILNASLGYTHFNDTTLNHKYLDLDGRTAIGSRGAAIAASKGMIVCNSAGNEGDGPWRHIGVPADAPGVIAVGALEPDGRHAAFSSYGPSADGRIKPDLSAPGHEVVVAGNVGLDLGLSSGTSLASPMLAGALAALWSSAPEKSAAEVLAATFAFADQAENPDNARGYGLPDFTLSWLRLNGLLHGPHIFGFDRANGQLTLLTGPLEMPCQLEIRNAWGQPVALTAVSIAANRISTLKISGLENLPAGFYQVVLRTETRAEYLWSLVWR